MSTKKIVAGATAGALFGVGLAVSGMTLPARVVGFLKFFAGWDPTLMFVMGGAVTVHLILLRLVLRREAPLFDSQFHLPVLTAIDARLLVGSAIFGIGWGLGGYCPGPGIVAMGALQRDAAVFVVAMAVGMVLERAFSRWRSAAPPPAA